MTAGRGAGVGLLVGVVLLLAAAFLALGDGWQNASDTAGEPSSLEAPSAKQIPALDEAVLPTGVSPETVPLALGVPQEIADGSPEQTPGGRPLREDEVMARFFGRVLDPRLQPVAGARVYLMADLSTSMRYGGHVDLRRLGRDGRLETLPHTATDADGRFSLRALLVTELNAFALGGSGPPRLAVVATGWPLHVFDAESEDPASFPMGDLVFDTPAGRVEITVQDASGLAVPGALCTVWNWARPTDLLEHLTLDAGAAYTERGITDGAGHILLTSLWPGTYLFEIKLNGWVSQKTASITVPVGEAQSLLVVLDTGGLVEGVVLDAQGQPVEGALVLAKSPAIGDAAGGTDEQRVLAIHRALRRWKQEALPETDADGHFRRSGLSGNTVRVSVTAPGYEPLRLDHVLLGTTDLRVVLQRAATAKVHLLSASTGEPVLGASLKAWRNSGVSRALGGSAELEITVSAEPDAPGTFSVFPLGTVSTRLVIEAADHAQQVEVIPGVSLGDTLELDLWLQPTARLTGRMIDLEGEAVRGVRVMLIPEQGGPGEEREGERVETNTGPRGVFELEGMSAGTWALRTWMTGYLRLADRTVEITTGDTLDLGDIVLAPAGIVEGTVTNADRQPAQGVIVNVGSRDGDGRSGGRWWSATTNADGWYRRDDLPAGLYDIRATPGASVPITLAESERRTVDLQLRRPPRLHGRVISGGVPVPGARVISTRVLTTSTGQRLFAGPDTTTDDLGNYELSFTQLDNTAHIELHARAPGGGGRSPIQELQLSWDQEQLLDLELASGSIAGRVAWTGGEAIDQQLRETIKLVLSREEWAETAPRPQSKKRQQEPTRFAADGSFRFEHLAPGHYTVRASGGGIAATQSNPLEVKADSPVEGLVLEVVPGATVTVRVLDTDGNPQRRSGLLHRKGDPASVKLFDSKDGSFSADGLGPGAWRAVLPRDPAAYRAAILRTPPVTFMPPVHAFVDFSLQAGEERTVTLVAVRQ